MLTSLRQFTVRLTVDMRSRVEAEALARSCSPSDVIRRALEQYLLGQKLIQDSELRHHRISEFSQIALDTIIREEYPEFRDRMVAEADKRVSAYHGAR